MSDELKALKVLKILDPYRLVINAGSEAGVIEKDRFLVYELGEELIDPETSEVLGRLEIVKGTGRPIHIQEKLTTIESTRTRQQPEKRRTVTKSGDPFMSVVAPTRSVEEIVEPSEPKLQAFGEVKVGDRAKKIN
jgi:hypothetical protein